jgi:predicted transcriptional regulator
MIMIEQNSDQAKGKKQKSMLDLLLEQLNLNYVEFSDYLGINRKTLFQYRSGQREFRLNWQQIRKLEVLLEKVNKRLKDLPDDWFRDIED